MRQNGIVVGIYLLATILTDAFFMGDTIDYAYSAITGIEFWEFGHLLWRPMGWALFQIFHPVTEKLVGANPRTEITLLFIVVNWLAGLTGVLLLRAFLYRFIKQTWVINLTTIAFIFSQAFLNYSQSGSSYVPGLTMLILGFYLMTADYPDYGWQPALGAGVALALAFCFWGIYLWGIPAALLSPLILFEFNKRTLRFVLIAAVSCALATALIYLSVLWHLGITNVEGAKNWVSASSQLMKVTSLSRVAFGIPRSLINLGNDGILFKRFLLKDPFNPVSVSDLFFHSLWKLLFFYGAIFLVVITLIRSRTGRRVLALLAINTLTIGAFAMFVDGSAVERYFPLYPTLFLAIGFALATEQLKRPVKFFILGFVIFMIAVNYGAMANWQLNARQDAAAKRLSPLLKDSSTPPLIFTVNQQDELVNFSRSFPFHSLNQSANLNVRPLLFINMTQVDRWREEFAEGALETWKQNGEAWISMRALQEQPVSEWNWVEGEDKRIDWRAIPKFISQFELGQTAGGDDGFIKLENSTANQAKLQSFIPSKSEKPEIGLLPSQ
ncbi:MAG: hypothetical protein AB1757_28905 [Acidobacteriota bacterium]